MECPNFVDLILEEKWVGLDGDAWLDLMKTTGRKVGRTGIKGGADGWKRCSDDVWGTFRRTFF